MAERVTKSDLERQVRKLEASNKRYKAAAKAYREDERGHLDEIKKLKSKVRALTAEIKEYEQEWADWDEDEASAAQSFKDREQRYKERIKYLDGQLVKARAGLPAFQSPVSLRDEEDVDRIRKLKAAVEKYQAEAADLREENNLLRAQTPTPHEV